MLLNLMKRKHNETNNVSFDNYRQIVRYYNLNVAFKSVYVENNHVWECDRLLTSKKRIGNYFIVMSSNNFYKYLCSEKNV